MLNVENYKRYVNIFGLSYIKKYFHRIQRFYLSSHLGGRLYFSQIPMIFTASYMLH